MMEFSILASGSERNAALLCTDKERLLIDNGLGLRELEKRLAAVGRRAADITSVLFTHEHGDHGSGLPSLLSHAKRHCSELTVYAAISEGLDWGRIELPPCVIFVPGRSFEIGDIGVEPFTVSHNARNPVNFRLTAGGVKIGFSTDLGFVPPAMVRLFSDCHIIVLESNYDAGMLESGSYTQELKDRISGPMGHLSNDQVGEYLANEKLNARIVVLTHLSQENNTVQIAEWSARRALLRAGSNAQLLVASQSEVLKVWGYE
jgi:phosphoribosyl 1,2-cyclic phosphodiesterase